MACYVETYEILGTTWGIEDHEDGRPAKDHFFHDQRTARYRLWRGGGGFGRADTLDEARAKLTAYAVQIARERLAKAEQEVRDCIEVIDAAETIGKFRVGKAARSRKASPVSGEVGGV